MDRLRRICSLVIIPAIAGILFCGLSSCKHDPLYNNLPEVSFKNDVQPILIANCTMSGCHGQVQPEDFSLITFKDVSRIITSGKPHKSELYQVATGSAGAIIMPPSPNSPLSDKQLTLIFSWIQQGGKDN